MIRLMSLAVVLLMLAGSVAGCGSKETQEQITQLNARVKALEDDNAKLKADLQKSQEELKTAQAALDEARKKPATPPPPASPVASTPTPSASPSATAQRPAGASERTLPGNWVSNGDFSLRVTRVMEYHSVADLGPLIRVGQEDRKGLDNLDALLGKGDDKLVGFEVALRNDTKVKQRMGYRATGMIWLRGAEGTEVNPWNDQPTSNGLTYLVQGGIPMDAETAPNNEVSGKVILRVKGWFEPAVVFTRPNTYGARELAVKLK